MGGEYILHLERTWILRGQRIDSYELRSPNYVLLVPVNVTLFGNRFFVLMCSVTSVVSGSLWPYGLQPAKFLCPWDSPGKNTGVGCHALLQGIFPIQGSNPGLLCLLHCRQFFTAEPQMKSLVAQLCSTVCDPMDCSSPGSSVPWILQVRTLEWTAIPFFRGSSQPRDQTGVSCIAGRFFTIWATGKSVFEWVLNRYDWYLFKWKKTPCEDRHTYTEHHGAKEAEIGEMHCKPRTDSHHHKLGRGK